jgi:hypothetical protein
MANPVQETKIELVTEAIETLVLATVIAVAPARNPEEHRANHQNVVDARATVSAAFRELLAPTFRLVPKSSDTLVERTLPANLG